MTDKPKPKSSAGEKELDRLDNEFKEFDKQVKELTLDRMNAAPKEELEPQTKIAQKDAEKMSDIYLKPAKAISSREKFNEKWREEYNFQKEYVQFIAEHNELIGANIEVWTKRFPGVPAEYWEVPTNKPVWGPRYLAEQLKGCSYHRMKTENRYTSQAGEGSYYGSMVVDTVTQRLDARPFSKRKSVFVGASF